MTVIYPFRQKLILILIRISVETVKLHYWCTKTSTARNNARNCRFKHPKRRQSQRIEDGFSATKKKKKKKEKMKKVEEKRKREVCLKAR